MTRAKHKGATRQPWMPMRTATWRWSITATAGVLHGSGTSLGGQWIGPPTKQGGQRTQGSSGSGERWPCCPFAIDHSPQARSRPLYYRGQFSGRGGNWVDGITRWGTRGALLEQNRHLAKVRVAGLNPVFRSKNSWPEVALRKAGCPSRHRILPITRATGCRGGYRQRFKSASGGGILEMRFYVGTDPDTGRRRWVTRTFDGSRADALRELKLLAAHANIVAAVGARASTVIVADLLVTVRLVATRNA